MSTHKSGRSGPPYHSIDIGPLGPVGTAKQGTFEFSDLFADFTKEIRCKNSNLLLGYLRVAIVEGHMTYLQSHAESIFLHPFYGLNSTVLIKKLEDSLHHHQELGWLPGEKEKDRLRLLCSALMHNLGCIKQSEPSLPRHEIAVASAGRLLGLAKWYFFVSSQRLEFPLYSVSTRNANLEWDNFKYWLDTAYEVRRNWSTVSRQRKQEDTKKAQEEALKQLRGEVYRAVDKRKVWNWIFLQIKDYEPAGRIETFKELFIEGDLNASNWIKDDVEDLQFVIANRCDLGNEIIFYIRKRLEGIKALIQDFYSGFTLLTKVQQDKFGNDGQTVQEKALLDSYDEKAEQLEVLPPAPERKDYATNGLWYKATGEWNILSKRWKQLQEEKKLTKPAPKTDLDPDSEGVEL